MRRTRKSYHEVLGVAHDAPLAEVKRAYRTLAKRLHPDRLHDPQAALAAEERLKEINAAWHDYLEALRSGERPAERRRPRPREPQPEDDDDRVDEATYEVPLWRQRRTGRQTRDRYRAERARATRDRDAREQRSREQVEQVRRNRDAEIRERVVRDRARAIGIVWIVGLGAIVTGLLVVLAVLVEFATR
jgi:curved DNA-binding protein CbpA